MKRAISLCILASASLLPVHSGTLDGGIGSAPISSPAASVRSLRDAGVVKQQHDYSCGAAALATLLTYGLSDPVDEQALLAALLELMSAEDQGAVRRLGLSLLDLQQLAQGRGHQAQGFRMAADQLAKLRRPVIVFIQPRGYAHFAVLKGIRGDRAFLADPSLGNVRMPLYRFVAMWADADGRGIVFAVEPKDGKWPDQSLLATPERPASLQALTARRLYETLPSFRGDDGIR
jgi:predicted double-glycine peptidase